MGQAAPPGCQSCGLREGGFCATLTDADLAMLGGIGRALAAGGEVFAQGEICGDVFHIRAGWVFLCELLDDGRRQILHFGVPGDLIGFHGHGRASFFGAQALTRVDLCVFSRQRLLDLVRRRPEVAVALLCQLADEESQIYERLTALGRKNAVERIATLLLELFCRIRRRAPQVPGETVKIPLTQTHIADAAGLTPVHTSRTLAVLRHSGVIDYGNGVLHILAPDRLFAIAGIDAATCPWPCGAEPLILGA